MRVRAAALAVALLGCDTVRGLEETPTPLVRIPVVVTGEPRAPLRVALVWGAQYLSDFFCLLPPESEEAAAVAAAGCRDPFGFVPQRVGAEVAVEPGVPGVLELYDLPAPDVMVGDLTARVGYASVVVYEDVDGNGALDLQCIPRGDDGEDERGGGRDCEEARSREGLDVVRGASFLTMTAPDQRIAFREGDFNAASAFYPRAGCPAPPQGFSLLGAGGFTRAGAVAAILQGQLPPEDPATCTALPASTPITVALQPAKNVREVGCGSGEVRNGFSKYEAPPQNPPGSRRPYACVALPDVGALNGEAPRDPIMQVVVASVPSAPCKYISHWILRGCENDARCENPEWDQTEHPPSWWPCPMEAP